MVLDEEDSGDPAIRSMAGRCDSAEHRGRCEMESLVVQDEHTAHIDLASHHHCRATLRSDLPRRHHHVVYEVQHLGCCEVGTLLSAADLDLARKVCS